MARKLIAKNVPLQTTKTYESCGQCHFYKKIDSYYTGGLRFDDDAGGPREVYKMGCNASYWKCNFEITNPDEVHRSCPYLDFEDSGDLLSQIELDKLLNTKE